MIARVSSISVVLLFLIAKANCQSRIESLENLLRSQISDSIRTKTLIDLSSEYQYKDFKKSIDFIDQALQLASLKEWTWAKAMAYEQKSFLNTINGDFNAAIISDQELLKLSVLDHDSSQIAKSLNFLGFDYEQLGEFDEAYYYFTQSYQMALSLHDSIKIAKSLINLASIYKELGQYNEALNYLDQCKKLFERMRDNSLQLYILDEAGDIYQRQNELDKAEESLILSLQLSRKFNARLLEPKVLQRLAQVSLKRNEYKKSFSYYDSAMRIYKKLNNQFGISEIKLGRGKIFLKQEKFDSALVETELSQTIARKIHAKKAEADCLAQLAELAELKNDFKKALSYYKSSKLLNDSIMSEETLAKTFQNQLRFETENKDSEIAKLTNFNKQQIRTNKQEELIRNILVVSMTLTAIVLFTVYRSGQRRLRINRLLLEHQEEIKQRALELDQLNKVKDKFFSIISHDLRSPINSLSSVLNLMENKALRADEFARLARELRLQFEHTKNLINNLLDWALMQMDKVKIQPEKINIKKLAGDNYQLLSSQHLKEITFVNKVEEDVFGFADANMINLVLRNLLTNALKFSENGGSITVDSSDKGDKYEIRISDNGVGMSEEVQKLIFEKTMGYSTRGTANEKGTGLGLILCKEFVEKNGGAIWVNSQLGKGSVFSFTIIKFKELSPNDLLVGS